MITDACPDANAASMIKLCSGEYDVKPFVSAYCHTKFKLTCETREEIIWSSRRSHLIGWLVNTYRRNSSGRLGNSNRNIRIPRNVLVIIIRWYLLWSVANVDCTALTRIWLQQRTCIIGWSIRVRRAWVVWTTFRTWRFWRRRPGTVICLCISLY